MKIQHKLSRYSGYLLLFTGILHSIVGLLMGWPLLLDMHNDGWLFSTLVQGKLDFQREAISWFLICGFFWILFGLCLQDALNKGFVPPASLGWGFILIGTVVAVIMPISGAYLFIIQGMLLLPGSSATTE